MVSQRWYIILKCKWVLSSFVLLITSDFQILFGIILHLTIEKGITQCVNIHWICDDSWTILTVLRLFVILFMIVHYSDVIMIAMAFQITGVSSVCSTVCSGAYQQKHQSSASMSFVRGIHWWPVDSPHKGPVTRKMFPFDDVIIHPVGRMVRYYFALAYKMVKISKSAFLLQMEVSQSEKLF